MPLYEYQCEQGHRFERIQKFSDPPVDTCPTCQSPVRKLLSSPAIQFKGSGFYITDYAKKSGGSDAGPSGDGGSREKKAGEQKEGSAKSDSSAEKPAAASPPSSSTKTE